MVFRFIYEDNLLIWPKVRKYLLCLGESDEITNYYLLNKKSTKFIVFFCYYLHLFSFASILLLQGIMKLLASSEGDDVIINYKVQYKGKLLILLKGK